MPNTIAVKNLSLEIVEWYFDSKRIETPGYQTNFKVSHEEEIITFIGNRANETSKAPTFKVIGNSKLKAKIEELDKKLGQKRPEIFIVYGHGTEEKNKLIELLEQYRFKPVVIEEHVKGSDELSKRLRELVSKSQAGIVLATPDDIGHVAEKETEKAYRWRQNVVLELGMILALKEQEYITILSKEPSDKKVEIPSDISGLFRTRFENSLEEVKETLLNRLFAYYGIKKYIEER